ncbi:hypothetical protein BOX15_Mlig013640g1 [Macrostomum lignano]|uniref:WSC domain-containing protein n=1 Tax=Macrostomum lignano TaxID=282301 RepID=A0A267H5K2_9PLAT|nr:hypothetical protein BOX15_Mlig013640g1 [Macrostomum lignano]
MSPLQLFILASIFLTLSSLEFCLTNFVPVQSSKFRYLGCYVDLSNRDLKGLQSISTIGPYSIVSSVFVYNTSMTLELCSQICAYGRFRYFGAQNTAYCSCGFTYGLHGAATEDSCSANCPGNSTQRCGASGRNSMYELTYPLSGNKMTVESAASMPNISATSSSIIYSSTDAGSSTECIVACHLSQDCLGCAFVPSSRMCRLLKFAAVPAEVASETEWVWMKL